MLLLPGSLPADRATLKALCVGLDAPASIAARLSSASVEPFSGPWSEAEREALGLTGDLADGQLWAAIAGSSANQYAVATPLHAALGLTDLTPLDSALISLSKHESRALCEAADQHLSVDRVRLSFVDTNTWLVTCTDEISVLTERPEWLIGEPLRPNLPRGKDARLVERWMNELQMLLFSHPVNAAREERGLPPINVVWLWGFGSKLPPHESAVLPPLPLAGEGWGEGGGARPKLGGNATALTPSPSPARGRGEQNHLTALRNGNIPVWQNAWLTRSSEILTADSIILGDSRPRLRLTSRKPSTVSKITAFFQHKPTLEQVLATLQQQL
jgi:hypothetical protein